MTKRKVAILEDVDVGRDDSSSEGGKIQFVVFFIRVS